MTNLVCENINTYFEEKELKKKYLKRYKKNESCLIRLRNKLEALEYKITSIKSTNYSCMPKSQISKTTSDLIDDKVDLEKRILKLENRGKRLKEETYDIIDTISDPKLVAVMECLFIELYNIDDAADILRLSNRQLLRRYKQALDLIELPKTED